MRSAALVLVVLGLSGMVLADRELPPADPRIGTWDGRTQSAELAGPYEDRLQQEIPFGARSYYLSPWRAYMDTWPAGRFLECLGINFNVEEKEAEATAEVLGQAGM